MADRRSAQKKKLSLTITTPRGMKFTEEADMIVMRTIDGDLGILPGHEALSTVLGDGVLRIKNNGREKHLAVFGGTADVSLDSIRILTTIAQRPEEIDLERAEEDRKAALEAMQEQQEEFLTNRLQILQTRALVRIHVSQTDYFDETDEDGEDVEDEADA